jgi:hypothetical protein
LAQHLTRLSETLETLGARLRQAVSLAVEDTLSAIVRETVRAVLADQRALATATQRFVPAPPPPRSPWSQPEDLDDVPWFDDADNHLPAASAAPPAHRREPTARWSGWPHALAVGVHTTIGWLRCRVGRFPVLTAVAVGLLTALASAANGPWAAAAVGLAGLAVNLLTLAEAIHSGAEALAAFGRS